MMLRFQLYMLSAFLLRMGPWYLFLKFHLPASDACHDRCLRLICKKNL